MVKEKGSKSWKMLGIQFNRSWSQMSHLMNSTLNDRHEISSDSQGIVLNDQIDKISDDETFDLMNNDVFTLKPSHELLKKRDKVNSTNCNSTLILSELDDSEQEENIMSLSSRSIEN